MTSSNFSPALSPKNVGSGWALPIALSLAPDKAGQGVSPGPAAHGHRRREDTHTVSVKSRHQQQPGEELRMGWADAPSVQRESGSTPADNGDTGPASPLHGKGHPASKGGLRPGKKPHLHLNLRPCSQRSFGNGHQLGVRQESGGPSQTSRPWGGLMGLTLGTATAGPLSRLTGPGLEPRRVISGLVSLCGRTVSIFTSH